MKSIFAAILSILILPAALAAGESVMLADFESGAKGIRLRESDKVVGSVKYELRKENGGNTCLALTFKRVPHAGYAYVYIPVTKQLAANAADYEGLSLRVKGNGSSTFGLIEIRTDDYVNIFQGIIPLTSTEWSTITLRWDRFFQVNDGTQEAAINWNALNVFAFGSRMRWGSTSFEVDDIKLVHIPEPKPVKAAPGLVSLRHSREKLDAGGEFTLVALGDSITAGVKLPRDKRSTEVYSARVARGLEKEFPGVSVRHLNRGVGGDTIAEGLVRIGHEVAPEKPDLVLVLLGANDAIYTFTDKRVKHTMSILIDELLRTTDADILLLGPSPIADKPGIPERYGKIYREIAEEKGIAYFDLAPVFSALADEDYRRAFADTVHLSEYGHKVAGKAVLDHILELVR